MSKIVTLQNSSGTIYPKTLAEAVYLNNKSLSELLNYTSANEGNFLRIVDGVPAWASIKNAEGVSF